jgi:tetratricopeptide (TPR) repeat protein
LAPELEAEILAGSSPGLGRVALAAMARARQAYARDRFLEAQREIKRARSVAPDSPAVLELSGLISYRLERWAEAVRFLDRFESLTGSIDQLPVVADCYRALGDFPKVQHYFERVRHEGASAAVVMEARLVMAGALADQGRLGEAIEVLGRPRTDRRNPALHHLRQWYALADLLERAGDIPNARLLFAHVAAIDPELGDVEARLSLLGAGRTRLHRASPSSSTGR